MKFVGLDIGGANLKFADSRGHGQEVFFPFWSHQHQFADVLAGWNQLPEFENALLGVTMTAELADCFPSKRAGVAFIVDSIEQVMGERRPLYYQTNGQLVDGMIAKRDWRLSAASNWHASTRYLSEDWQQSEGFLLDIGSTTTDLIPFRDYWPVDSLQTDFDRLARGQLIYMGQRRTPIFALLDQVTHADQQVSAACEWFATIDDAFLWLGDVEPDPDDCATADHRPRTVEAARRRLAKVLCCESDELSNDWIDAIAYQAKNRLLDRLVTSISQTITDHAELERVVLLAGGGSQVAEQVLVQVGEQLGITFQSFGSKIDNGQLVPATAVARFRQAEANRP